MSKTLTTFEALKANETKRVRPVGVPAWREVREMIEALDRGLFETREGVRWEAEETIYEGFAVLPKIRRTFGYQTVEEAERVRSQMVNPDAWEVVHVREVRP